MPDLEVADDSGPEAVEISFATTYPRRKESDRIEWWLWVLIVLAVAFGAYYYKGYARGSSKRAKSSLNFR